MSDLKSIDGVIDLRYMETVSELKFGQNEALNGRDDYVHSYSPNFAKTETEVIEVKSWLHCQETENDGVDGCNQGEFYFIFETTAMRFAITSFLLIWLIAGKYFEISNICPSSQEEEETSLYCSPVKIQPKTDIGLDLSTHNRWPDSNGNINSNTNTIFEDADFFSMNYLYKLMPITFGEVDETIIHIEHDYCNLLSSSCSSSEAEDNCSRTLQHSEIKDRSYRKRKHRPQVVDAGELLALSPLVAGLSSRCGSIFSLSWQLCLVELQNVS